ncbi:hypothetical protein K1T71_004817 [Dendrolimus kikuchii]|uniref:Uncharacterized protein n=1 Tax=Dendrolimus kikuchii TaxID=765133 RepID=A0ACC1D5M6_9NEOP|nr:hypothetical protein K1T71_004817 [Dendrolimus kikuchii]
MFKIPDWEDVPKSNATFNRKSKMKKHASQKSPITSKIKNDQEKIGKLSKNKLPVFNQKQNGKIQKSQKQNFSQKEKLQTHNKNLKSDKIGTKKMLRKDIRTNRVMVKGSLLRQQKNEKNNQMMNRRLQNKLEKGNKNKSTNGKEGKNKIKEIHKTNLSNRTPTQKYKNKQHNNQKLNYMEKRENNTSNEIVNDNNSKGNKRKRKTTESDGLEIQNFDSDMLDEIVINAKKKKLNESLQNDDDEHKLFNEIDEKPKTNRKKEMLRKVLAVNSRRNHIEVKGNKLRERMLERLKVALFYLYKNLTRFFNRYKPLKNYQTNGDNHLKFHCDKTTHSQVVGHLPDWMATTPGLEPKTHIVADMGCGEAALSRRVRHKVRSFDLVASAPDVEACDMAHTPLLADSVDVAVYCLALMGTDLTQYLIEANRVLKMGGHLLIAEVESRFEEVEAFAKEVQRLGFKLKNLDKSHKVFFFMEFTKIKDPPAKKSKLPTLTLKPCLYKRR